MWNTWNTRGVFVGYVRTLFQKASISDIKLTYLLQVWPCKFLVSNIFWVVPIPSFERIFRNIRSEKIPHVKNYLNLAWKGSVRGFFNKNIEHLEKNLILVANYKSTEFYRWALKIRYFWCKTFNYFTQNNKAQKFRSKFADAFSSLWKMAWTMAEK